MWNKSHLALPSYLIICYSLTPKLLNGFGLISLHRTLLTRISIYETFYPDISTESNLIWVKPWGAINQRDYDFNVFPINKINKYWLCVMDYNIISMTLKWITSIEKANWRKQRQLYVHEERRWCCSNYDLDMPFWCNEIALLTFWLVL